MIPSCAYHTAALLALLLVALPVPAGTPAACGDCAHDFGPVREGATLRHAFVLRNPGHADLRLAGAQLSPPLQLAKMPAVVPAGGQASLELTLDTAGLEDGYEGRLVLAAADGRALPDYSVSAQILPRLEVRPLPAFFAVTQRGEARTFALEIVNHDHAPQTLALPATGDRPYGLALDTLEPGRRWRLTLSLPATLPAGRIEDHVELPTATEGKPLFIGVHANVRERVHTFPDTVDFGHLARADLGTSAGAAAGAVQNLMVYQHAGSDFTLTATSDVRGLRLEVERGATGDRVQVVARLDPATVPAGPLRGAITLHTNDPAQPELRVPVSGNVAD